MRRLLVALVSITSMMALATNTAVAQEDDGSDQSGAETAMEGLIQTLSAMIDTVIERTEPGSTERAEGLRHILRMVEMQNGGFTDDADAANPVLSRCPGGVCKLGMDNPDFTYQAIGPLSAEFEYRITGSRGTVPYITMQIFEGALGGDVTMTSEDLVVDEDGTFEIILSATEPPDASNWMQLNDQARRFLARQGYNDWNTDEEASFAVEVIGGPDLGPVPHLSDEEFVDDVGNLSLVLSALIPLMQDTRAGWPVNALDEPRVGAFGIENAGFPTTFGTVGVYELAEDEAMIIEMSDHDVIHGGIQLGNVWLESLDYRTRQTSLNWHQSTPDSDGQYRYVLAHTDPGTANWLDVSGHGEGSIFIRWQDPDDADMPEQPIVTLVPLAEVTDLLPADHQMVTLPERAEALDLRAAAINRRRNPVEYEFTATATATATTTTEAPPPSTPTEDVEEAAAATLEDDGKSDSNLAVVLAVLAALAAGALGWQLGRRRG